MSEPKDLDSMAEVSAKIVSNLTTNLAIVDKIVAACEKRIAGAKEDHPNCLLETRDVILIEDFGVSYAEGMGWMLPEGCCCPLGAVIFEYDPPPFPFRTDGARLVDADPYQAAASVLEVSRAWAVGFVAEVDKRDNTANTDEHLRGREAAKIVLQRLGLRP